MLQASVRATCRASARRAATTVVPARGISSVVRNCGIIAHIDAGKTTTTERMLLLSGATRFAGSVDTGDTVMDYLQQERERGITIQSAATRFHWRDHELNLIDTPGCVRHAKSLPWWRHPRLPGADTLGAWEAPYLGASA